MSDPRVEMPQGLIDEIKRCEALTAATPYADAQRRQRLSRAREALGKLISAQRGVVRAYADLKRYGTAIPAETLPASASGERAQCSNSPEAD